MKAQLPIAIIVAALIIGGSFYAIQVNKQKSIEKQQQIEIQETRRADELKAAEDATKAEQAETELDAKRKSDCLDVYKTESDKWNNVTGWRYDEISNSCYVVYKNDKPKSDAECDKEFPSDKFTILLTDNLLCKEGNFQTRF